MDEATLISRLGGLQPPRAELAKSQALNEVPAQVRAARSDRPGRPRRLWPRLVTVSAMLLVLLVSFSALTAPGQAVATWIGDRLGLGQPGGPPALQSLYGNAVRGTEGEPAYVLLRGPGPLGGHYEFITYRMPAQPGGALPADGVDCFQLQFSEPRNLFHAGCGLPSPSDGLLYTGIGGNSAPGAGYQFASGRVSEDVAAVDFQIDGQGFPVELKPVPADLIDRFDIPRPFKFFIVLLPGDLHDGEVKVTARDAEGNPVASRRESLLGASVIQP